MTGELIDDAGHRGPQAEEGARHRPDRVAVGVDRVGLSASTFPFLGQSAVAPTAPGASAPQNDWEVNPAELAKVLSGTLEGIAQGFNARAPASVDGRPDRPGWLRRVERAAKAAEGEEEGGSRPIHPWSHRRKWR